MRAVASNRRVRSAHLAALAAIAAVSVACAQGPAPASTAPLPGRGAEPPWWTAVIETSPDAGAGPSEPTEPPRVVLTIPADVLFASGSARLEPAGLAVLDDVAARLRAGAGAVVVEGHTDVVGTEASNLALGQARAAAAARRLVDAGVEASRITTVSHGEVRPVAGCHQVGPGGVDDPDCRARCRRVGITFEATP